MRWIVLGAQGMLGQDLVPCLERAGHAVRAVDRDTVDITDPVAVDEALAGVDVAVNCAAFTSVDEAEAREPDAFAINATGAGNIARAAARHGVRLVHISTDYVFPGVGDAPYAELAAPAPVSAYGRTKLAGEWAVRAEAPDHLVVRTAWLYGAGGKCFPRTIARLAAEREALQVVADQVGQPTWTVDLSALVLELVTRGVPTGTYHGTSSGHTSWFEFARTVVASAGRDPEMVAPVSSAQAGRAAVRPAWSVLGHDALRRAGIEPIGPWQERWAAASATVLEGVTNP